RLWMRLLGRAEAQGVINEDATGVAAVAEMASGGHGVFVNGKHHSQIPFGGTHTRLGAAPAIVHPNPLDVAIIGLGSGDTAWASGCRPETRHMTVFEISGGQPGLLAAFVARTQYAPMRSLLSDPRLRIVVDDGRRALQSSDARYDVIEADALWPMVAYAGNLYSEEFFTMCASRLKPGGLLCTWAPTPRVYSTFVTVMPYVIGIGDRQIRSAAWSRSRWTSWPGERGCARRRCAPIWARTARPTRTGCWRGCGRCISADASSPSRPAT